MKLKKFDRDVYAGLFMLVLGTFFLFETNNMYAKSAIFPRIILVIFIILAFILLVMGLKKKPVESESDHKGNVSISLIVYILIGLYVVGLKYIGFYISTSIFIPSMILFFKKREIKTIILSTLVTIIFLHFLIAVQLKLALP